MTKLMNLLVFFTSLFYYHHYFNKLFYSFQNNLFKKKDKGLNKKINFKVLRTESKLTCVIQINLNLKKKVNLALN